MLKQVFYLLLYFSSPKIIDISNLALLSPEAQCKARLNFVQKEKIKMYVVLSFFKCLKSHLMSVHISRESGCTQMQRCLCVCALMHGGAEPPAHKVGLKCTEIS